MATRKFNALPGFSLTMGVTAFFLTVMVLIPFAGLVVRACGLSWHDFWKLATNARAMSAYRLTFGASFFAAIANVIFGTLLAWVLVRYEFPGRRIIDAMVDFPFALPTAVAGITLANLFVENGWLGRFLVPHGINVAYTSLGVAVALTFVGMPFVVRTLQPVLEHLEREVEEAAATLGAGRLGHVGADVDHRRPHRFGHRGERVTPVGGGGVSLERRRLIRGQGRERRHAALLGLSPLRNVDSRRKEQREHQRYRDQDAELGPLSRACHSVSELQ